MLEVDGRDIEEMVGPWNISSVPVNIFLPQETENFGNKSPPSKKKGWITVRLEYPIDSPAYFFVKCDYLYQGK